MFLERGFDFFNQDEEQRQAHKPADDQEAVSQSNDTVDLPSDGQATETTSPEALSNMRLEILPQLQYVRVLARLLTHRLKLPSIALGEMTLAKDVLSLFAASTAPAGLPSVLHADSSSVVPPNDLLASSSVSQPPSIASVQSFNARLIAGGKDEALRKASELFKSATIAVERGHDFGARYWIDALKIRRRNWGLTPAPQPFGMPTGRGADRTTKDFLISFGLSECMLFPPNSHTNTHPNYKHRQCFVRERLANSPHIVQKNRLYSREGKEQSFASVLRPWIPLKHKEQRAIPLRRNSGMVIRCKLLSTRRSAKSWNRRYFLY